MRSTFLTALVGGALAVAGCRPETPRQAVAPAPAAATNQLAGVWQLDGYPDSLLLKKDIYQYSDLMSAGAYNLRFVADSCESIGWHDSGWSKVNQIDNNSYFVGSGSNYVVVKTEADRLLYQEVSEGDSGRVVRSEWFPYHRVPAVLTQVALAKRVAREVFAGRYRVLQSDVPTDSVVTLGPDFDVQGVHGIAYYGVVTDMDWDFLLPNAFSWRDSQGEGKDRYSFEFAGDTLLLHGFDVREEDDSVPSGILVTEPLARFLKLPAEPPRAAPVAAPK